MFSSPQSKTYSLIVFGASAFFGDGACAAALNMPPTPRASATGAITVLNMASIVASRTAQVFTNCLSGLPRSRQHPHLLIRRCSVRRRQVLDQRSRGGRVLRV